MRFMYPEICDIPTSTLLDRQIIEAAYFRDSYCARVTIIDASLVENFFAIFGHHPWWIKRLLIFRNRVGALAGLDVPSDTEIIDPEIKHNYRVGDRIGPWPIFHLSDTELVAGRDNKHLDFRLSLLRENNGNDHRITVSTICNVNNIFGKIYLFFIVPFHKWGVQRIIANAVSAGRL